jgi:hypothetical protein
LVNIEGQGIRSRRLDLDEVLFIHQPLNKRAASLYAQAFEFGDKAGGPIEQAERVGHASAVHRLADTADRMRKFRP